MIITNFIMCHIHVTTYYNRLLGLKIFDKLQELWIPFHSPWKSDQFPSRIWHI